MTAPIDCTGRVQSRSRSNRRRTRLSMGGSLVKRPAGRNEARIAAGLRVCMDRGLPGSGHCMDVVVSVVMSLAYGIGGSGW